MHTHAEKTQENKSQSVADAVSKKQNGSESIFQFADNRPEAVAQRKLQEMVDNSPRAMQLKTFQDMANNSVQSKRSAQLQSMTGSHYVQQQPVQMVLRSPADTAREANLVQTYHVEETAGDNSRDHKTAIGYYRAGITARRTANALHVSVDQGHLDAITVLQEKITGRERAIAEAALPSAKARARARRRDREATDQTPAPRLPSGPIGTEDKASWLPGNQPAWFPRSHGT
jgi:uncharacterized protein with FMN-binding domain